MTEVDRWLAANGAYLNRELIALRKRIVALAERAEAHDPPAPAVAVQPKAAGLRRWFRSGDSSRKAEPVAAPVDALAGPEASEDAAEAPDTRYVPALAVLAQRLGLSDFERQLLLMCAAMEFDTGFGALCSRAQRGASNKGPTFELALAALENPAWDVMSPERPLRYWRLIEIHQPAAQPLIASALRADERIVNYIKGLNYLDDRLAPLVETIVVEGGAALPPSQLALADAISDCLADGAQPPLFQLLGDSAASKLAVAREVSTRAGMRLYRLRGETAPAAQGDSETFVRLWQREAALLPLALYIDAEDVPPAQVQAVERLLNRCGGLVFVASRQAWRDVVRPNIVFEAARPLPAEQRQLWIDALGTDGGSQADLLAGQFNLDQSAIGAIAAGSAAKDGDSARRDEMLWAAALDRTRPALDQLAQPIQPQTDWDDIELPTRERAQLAEIAAQVRNRTAVYDDWGFRARLSRGLGISVLFAGDSGTGKTMAAEVLARELKLLLYRIDLSGVVSKFIGETEKNLRKLFDAAEDGGAILFFDEADALFGKRSEVKDSHDRYANIEINYLLQRMEGYRGLAILTTNMKSSLDQAFVRRLRFIVNFPFPAAAERAAIWRKVFPPAVDTAMLDFGRLARLNLTGGSIHNIALNAAFAAVASGGSLTMPIVLEAARSEFQKLDKPINDSDFRWLESVEGAA
ncbi:ATP-binding protein [Allosphingosinicella deserti]|uniref:AAA family ATPase n=1 Tax=Allosphingosinicella deserti TaxID=2116704 RepID=A0A2P7QZH8_9SPHN|nr:ATP-binding protein [Sphingomonas deserti]PSJ43359.1 AAA family ATPase [Sphingomonas deserti]